jgi:hypothetical protein
VKRRVRLRACGLREGRKRERAGRYESEPSHSPKR